MRWGDREACGGPAAGETEGTCNHAGHARALQWGCAQKLKPTTPLPRAAMFQSLKDKLSTKLEDLRPLDALDRAVQEIVDRGTREELIAPDWAVNLELCDFINQNPGG